MAYTKHTWTNGSGEALNATNLNEIETGINEAHNAIDNTSTGHNHDGIDSKKVVAENVTNIPAGGIAATDVQAAIDELDAEKVAIFDLPSLSVSKFQANSATGTCINPASLNDNNTDVGNYSTFYSVNEYGEVLFTHPTFVREFRQFGHTNHIGDGKWKLQYLFDSAWIDLNTNISVVTSYEWSSWILLTEIIYTKGIRIVATSIDTSKNKNYLTELECRG